MTYQDQWRAISARMRGLTQSAHLYARFLSINSGDPNGSSALVGGHIETLQSSLRTFHDTFATLLPPAANEAIERFLERSSKLTGDKSGSGDSRKQRVWAALVMLEAFESELTFILSDSQQAIRARSERAFSHLQRMIVVDHECRRKWKIAFEEGEVECEKLGALHLLLHGIYAFKVHAAGGRTDLVYQDHGGGLAGDLQYVDGLALTEWKIATSAGEAVKKCEAARSQAKRYAMGVLAGNELTSYRFVVIVSEHQIDLPPDLAEDEVVYRHINVAVDPRPPSRT